MKTAQQVIEKSKQLTRDEEYIAVFADGSISEVLTIGTMPPSSEGDYIRIFGSDSESDILSKLGSIGL